MMKRYLKYFILIIMAFIFSIISIHLSEDKVLYLVAYIKSTYNYENNPTIYALKGYGKARDVLENYYGLSETLPFYRQILIKDNKLLEIADYFLKHTKYIKFNKKFCRYIEFHIDKPNYNLKGPWVSALAQSFIGQIFLASFIITKDNKYLKAAKEIACFLEIPVNKGGVLIKFNKNNYWYAEYAKLNFNPPCVLNGHIITLDFLRILYNITKEKHYKFLFDKGFSGLYHKLDNFVDDYWSYYDLRKNYANLKYHKFHIRQLKAYEVLDKSGKIKFIRRKMEKQLLNPLGTFIRLVNQPTKLLIIMFTIYFTFYTFLFFLAYLLYIKIKIKLTKQDVE